MITNSRAAKAGFNTISVSMVSFHKSIFNYKIAANSKPYRQQQIKGGLKLCPGIIF